MRNRFYSLVVVALLIAAASAFGSDMPRTPVFSQNQPGGLYVITNFQDLQGDAWFVDSNDTDASDAAGYGLNPDTPFATLDYAVGQCSAGDMIFLAPGHAETLTSATSAAIDVSSINIIGLGSGTRIPTFTLGTDAAACIAVTGSSVRIENVKIVSDLADVAAGITLSAAADGATIERCLFSDGAAAKELVIGVSIAANCDNVTISQCTFLTVDGGGCASAIKLVGAAVNCTIVDCAMSGDWSAAAIDNSTAAATNLLLIGNSIDNADATDDYQIHASSTGYYSESLADAIAGANGIENFPASAAPADGVSLAAALRIVYDAQQGTAGIASYPAGAAPANAVSMAEVIREIYDVITGTDGIAAFPASAAPANDVSLAEVLRIIYDAQQGTAGIATYPAGAAPDNAVSIAEVIREIYDVMTGTDGIASFPAAAAPANNVSVAESIRYISENQSWRLASKSTTPTSQGASTLFTVTGDVECEVFAVCTVSLSDTGSTGTIEVGISGNTAALIAQTTATDIDEYEVWIDTGPATVETKPSAVILTNGTDVIETVGTEDLTGGGLTYYCRWRPLSATGAVVAP